MDEEKHILTMLVDNEPGVLSRIVGLFSARGYNIESLCVAPTIDPQVSRITLVTKANLPELEQIEKQLRKLINVIKLRDLSGERAVKREMALVCVKAKPEHRAEILRIVDIFRCKVVDTGLEHAVEVAVVGVRAEGQYPPGQAQLLYLCRDLYARELGELAVEHRDVGDQRLDGR